MISNCCSAEDRDMGMDGPSYRDMGICPECHEHCEFIDGEINMLDEFEEAMSET